MIQLEISRTEYNFNGHLKFAGPALEDRDFY
jgi:hypothetical protein